MIVRRITIVVKKRHSSKWILISDVYKNILFVGEIHLGKVHDFTIFKQELASYDFSKINVWVDLSFIGINKHILAKQMIIPIKGTKNKPLTQEQKDINKHISSKRVKIENAISGIKRYFILVHRSRMKIQAKLDEAMNICSNLLNLLIKFRKPLAINQ
ncbi:transposase family protein [Siphonobacter sp. SORGH_AS_1065]|uniref:transposase family protein n=1 Tax=Siphonobacter sp. SORGH_AS_1065 TaxID=3041795 RepID=UPI00277DCB4B|nr:transposase family protein [Siphonobacter sp. SORGH_AS_1065]MDQ1090072.1 hypothetical protein [Siphonobacter sp. SORGH_AS_1065]